MLAGLWATADAMKTSAASAAPETALLLILSVYAFARRFPAWLRGKGVRHFTMSEIADVGRRTILDVSDPEVRAEAESILEVVLPPEITQYAVELMPPPVDLWANILPTLMVASWVRAANGSQPVDVNGAWRDPLYNLAVGGAPASVHMTFQAIDFNCRGRSPRWTATEVAKHPDAKALGIGLYNTFVHMDTRGYTARWPKSGPNGKWWEKA